MRIRRNRPWAADSTQGSCRKKSESVGPNAGGSKCKPLVRHTEVRIMGMKTKGREQNQVRAGEEVGEAEHRPPISLKLERWGTPGAGCMGESAERAAEPGFGANSWWRGLSGTEYISDPIWCVSVPECAHAPSQNCDCPPAASVPRPAPRGLY